MKKKTKREAQTIRIIGGDAATVEDQAELLRLVRGAGGGSSTNGLPDSVPTKI